MRRILDGKFWQWEPVCVIRTSNENIGCGERRGSTTTTSKTIGLCATIPLEAQSSPFGKTKPGPHMSLQLRSYEREKLRRRLGSFGDARQKNATGSYAFRAQSEVILYCNILRPYLNLSGNFSSMKRYEDRHKQFEGISLVLRSGHLTVNRNIF